MVEQPPTAPQVQPPPEPATRDELRTYYATKAELQSLGRELDQMETRLIAKISGTQWNIIKAVGAATLAVIAAILGVGIPLLVTP